MQICFLQPLRCYLSGKIRISGLDKQKVIRSREKNVFFLVSMSKITFVKLGWRIVNLALTNNFYSLAGGKL